MLKAYRIVEAGTLKPIFLRVYRRFTQETTPRASQLGPEDSHPQSWAVSRGLVLEATRLPACPLWGHNSGLSDPVDLMT